MMDSQLNPQVIQISTGVSALWVLANICYAGMKAQGHPSRIWRVLSFLFGLPGTLLSLLVVQEGGENAYGIYLPKRRRDTL